MIEYKTSTQKDLANGSEFSVRVFGIGGAGANSLDRIALEGMEEADLLSMNTDVRALSTSVSSKKVQLGRELTKGLGAGGDPELGREAAMEAADEIREAVKGQSMIFICVGLGGGTGSGAAPVVARIAEQEGAFVVVFATFPFSFEGRRRLEQAQTALEQLGTSANATIIFENDRMGELILAKEGIQKAFAAADKIISQSVRAVTQLVTKTGLIHIGLDDLISALRNTDSRCLFGYGRAKGDNRAQAAIRDALKSPLLDRGQLAQASNVLVHICGGETLTLFEVELLMKELGKTLRDDAQIFFGTSTDTTMGDDIGITLITSLPRMAMRRLEEEEAEESDAEPTAAAASASVPAADAQEEEVAPARVAAPPPEEQIEVEAPVTVEDAEQAQEPVSLPVLKEAADSPSEEVVVDVEPTEEEAVAVAAAAKRKASQQELKLNPGARGRFEKSEPTIIDGEDLDVPTFLRDRE